MGAHSGDGDALSAGGPGAGVLALTFDDGPAPGNDSEILRLLARHGAVATFFVIGSAIGAHFELLERMVAAGCEIGNHSWSHAVLPGLPPGVQRGEVRATNEVLAGIGIRPRWFRPPYGRTGAETEAIARAEGLESILWSLDSQDWTGHGADETARRVIGGLASGAVILLHSTADNSVAALPRILEHAAGRGYRFVTLSEWRRLAGGGEPVSAEGGGAGFPP